MLPLFFYERLQVMPRALGILPFVFGLIVLRIYVALRIHLCTVKRIPPRASGNSLYSIRRLPKASQLWYRTPDRQPYPFAKLHTKDDCK
ncbi:hypothetical protein BDZ91DRAFT_720302 [Kalaharituber pfeilii]|nr:hypothetical protein BDZ91DRAFT_720302 [Kalaharituber pfeilii]